MSRFNLDPRAAEPRPPPPAALPPPAAAAPPPRPPPAPEPAAAEPRPRRRLVVIGAIVLAVLLLGGALAVYGATALAYPGKYTLDDDEMPSGMSNARLSASERDRLGVKENPGKVDRAKLEEQFGRRDEEGPADAHLQVLATAQGGRVASFALRYADEEKARDATAELRAVCAFNGAVMRDGKVVVLIVAEGAAGRSQAREVGNALREKTSDLRAICGF